MLRVAFILNPIAGMGGRVGLKGTDAAVDEARAKGAEPVAPDRAAAFLAGLRARQAQIEWLTAAGPMGAELLHAAGALDISVVHEPRSPSSGADTRATARAALWAGAQVVVFVGGDGTARDVAAEVQGKVPILGVPAGVKMHSAVFALNPAAAADLVADYGEGQARVVDAEVLDVDEEAYRRGEWRVQLFATARTLDEPHLRQVGKMAFEEVDESAQRDELAEHVADLARTHPGTLFLLGPGSTMEAVKLRLGLQPTLLGFDAFADGPAGRDLGERGLLALLDRHRDAFLVVSPIGAQGFVLGRGNQQASAAVIRRVGLPRLLILATPAKIRATPQLHVDTGDADLDAELRARAYLSVLVGLRTSRLMPIA